MQLKVIAYARNGHTDKFGIPRQSREDSPIVTRIVFEPEFAVREALRGIEEFSHLWLIWGFSEVASLTANAERPSQSDCKTANAERPQAEPAVGLSWSPTVRPPRLGGNKRMGVFATRSPFRPNPIGLTSVKLLKVAYPKSLSEGKNTMELYVTGADLLDGTPIYDVKPYLSFSDSHEDAKNGFADAAKDYRLEVRWDVKPSSESIMEGHWKEDVEYILRQDPRPGYQDDPTREYKLDYGGYTVTFVVSEGQIIVKNIQKTSFLD